MILDVLSFYYKSPSPDGRENPFYFLVPAQQDEKIKRLE